MDGIDIAKLVIRIAIVVGSSKIVNGIIVNNVPMDGTITKVAVKVTAFAAGGFLAKELTTYTDKQIDELVALVRERQPTVFVPTS